MSRKHCKNKITHHSHDRLIERTGWSKKESLEMITQASRHGLAPLQLEKGPLQDFCIKKGMYKRLKVYKNYIFIFSKNSDRLITLYKVPESLTVGAQNNG